MPHSSRLDSRVTDPVVSARTAGLRHVSDGEPGIRRVPGRRGFKYTGPAGTAIGAAAELARIRALAVPPAWTDVWICRDAHGHLQATGRDARGRKQYRYHPGWRACRDQTGNTRAVCRKSYIHPAIIDSYIDGSMSRTLRRRARAARKVARLPPDEIAVLALLQQKVGREARKRRAA